MALDRKLMFFMLLFVYGTIMTFTMAGQTGIASTVLFNSITAESTADLQVTATSLFLDSDAVMIDDEFIEYTGTTATSFTGITRGARGSDAASHGAGTVVHNEPMGIINAMMGFRVLDMLADNGLIIGGFQVATALPGFFVNSVMKLMLWDFEFLEGNGIWLRAFLWVLNVGLAISLISWALKRGT